MDDNDTEYAVKTYQKKQKLNNYCYEEFRRDILEHIRKRPIPFCSYDPFSLESQTSKLWRLLNISMKDLVKYSKLDMAKFSRRFCIPYRTLQAWCDSTNPCPIYIKIMLGEILKIYKPDIHISLN